MWRVGEPRSALLGEKRTIDAFLITAESICAFVCFCFRAQGGFGADSAEPRLVPNDRSGDMGERCKGGNSRLPRAYTC